MAKRKAEEKKGLDEWMATYSDMVTLLLCFFVLLYAASTPNETKFQYIFQAFSSSGEYINPFVSEEGPEKEASEVSDGNSESPMKSDAENTSEDATQQGSMPQSFDQLFNWVENVVSNNNMSSFVSVEEASSRIYIRFDSSIMFEGDSAVLLDTGKKALRLLFPGIKAVEEYIQTVIVSGHTAAGISYVNDWDLSAARACSVTKYMDFSIVVPSEKFKAEGRGQYDPIESNDTEEGRAKNRRVELIIVRNNLAVENTDIMMDILKYDYNLTQQVTDPEERDDGYGSLPTDSVVGQIIKDLNDRYESNATVGSDTSSDFVGPDIALPITGIDTSLQVSDEDLAVDGETSADEAAVEEGADDAEATDAEATNAE